MINTEINNEPLKTNSSSFETLDLDQEEPRQRPTLIVHIGPSKTGTTTIQMDSRDFTDSLEMDNYIYAGKRSVQTRLRRRLLANNDCLYKVRDYLFNNRKNNGRCAMDIPCWKKRMKGVVSGNISKNIILSDEGYSYVAGLSSPQFFNKTYNRALQIAYQDWDFFIVPTYRRYFEWVVSVTKQFNAANCLVRGGWPHEDGKPCVKIWDSVDNLRRRKGTGRYSASFYQNIDATIPAWTEGGGRFTTLNFHAKRHITSSFYCDIIKNTPHTCLHSLNRTVGTHGKNRSVLSTACSIIVFQAAKIGLITNQTMNQTTQINASIILEEYILANGRTYSDLPLSCPNRKLLEDLLHKSLEFEEKMMPEFYRSPEGEKTHRQEFWYQADVKKIFCDVDVDQVLANTTTWSQVLTRLKSANIVSIVNNN